MPKTRLTLDCPEDFSRPTEETDQTADPSLRISKSDFCKAVRWPKVLWLKRRMPEEWDAGCDNRAIMEQGSEVGDLAMGLFGKYTEVPYGAPEAMTARTEELLTAGEKVIAEASFAYDGLFCSVDILKNNGDKNVEIYEVKSATAVSDSHIIE